MWTPILFCLFVGLTSAEWGWKAGSEYNYNLEGRTMTGLNQVGNQFSGVFYKAGLKVFAETDQLLVAQVYQAEYAPLQANLSGGWASDVPQQWLQYKQLPIGSLPFQLQLKNGVITGMNVDKKIPTWELNILKGIATQLQVDTQGENLKKSKYNQIPEGENGMGVYKTMEDSVYGVYETNYEISPLPEYILELKPEIAPLAHLRGENGQIYDIIKTRNFSNSEQHMVYHYGFNAESNWKAGSSQMGNFLTRSSTTRTVISGNLKDYIIQSSITDDKIILAPHLYNGQKGIVASRMNLTLESVSSSPDQTTPSVSNGRQVENLVYEYEPASQHDYSQNHETSRRYVQEADSSSSSSESSSSQSSSEEGNHSGYNMGNKGYIRNKQGSSENKNASRHGKSSSSSSSSSSESSEGNQQQRNAGKGNYGSSESDSSSSSSEEHSNYIRSNKYLQPRPQLEEAPYNSLSPFFIGYKGNSIHAAGQENVINKITEIAQEVGQSILNPNTISSEGTLSKFNILNDLIQTSSASQLKKTSDILYYPYSKVQQGQDKKEAHSYQAWTAYRDAVGQAGTGPALVTLREWIKSGKVSGEEAAQLFAALPQAARHPTTDYTNYFFEILKDDKVMGQRFLNTSVLYSFTDLVRKVKVNRRTSQNRYPVYLYGSFYSGNEVVGQQYIPYLQKQLSQAVSDGDSVKIQAYIRALGNIAHPQILSVFKPYLEGEKPISNFQRLTIIAAMDHLAQEYSQVARPVFHKIYQNKGETQEVRVAAVMQLMKTNPPAQMLQEMAQNTNYEHSRQVKAAVKSAIETTARMEPNTYTYEKIQNAKSAVHLLTSEDFGVQYSRNFIKSYLVKEQALSYKNHFAYVQGSNSFLPSSVFYNLKRSLGGYKRESHEINIATSSADDILNMLTDQFYYHQDGQQQRSYQRSKQNQGSRGQEWTVEKISNLLELEQGSGPQAEGNFLFSGFGGKRFFTFDNHTIEQLPQMFYEAQGSLQAGQNFNFTKYYNQFGVEIAFPTSTGLPFFYSYQVPTLVYLGGQVKGYLQPEPQQGNSQQPFPDQFNVHTDYQFAYSSKKQGKMGFVTPFDSQHYVAGLDQNVDFFIPLQSHLTFNYTQGRTNFRATFEPLQKEQVHKMFEISQQAYTSQDNILEATPSPQGPNYQPIHVRSPTRTQLTVGDKQTGFAFDVYAETESKSFNFYQEFYQQYYQHDPISFFLYPSMGEPINNYNYSVSHNPHKSSSRKAVFQFSYSNNYAEGNTYDEGYKGQQQNIHSRRRSTGAGASEESGQGAFYSGSSSKRQQEFFKNVQSGMKNAQAQVFDLSVSFEGSNAAGHSFTGTGPNAAEYSFTAAYAQGGSDKSRLVMNFNKAPGHASGGSQSYQVAFQLEENSPQVPLYNFNEASNANPTTTIKGSLKYGKQADEGEIVMTGRLSTSQERRQYLKQHPLAAVCQEQMQNGYYQQSACRNVTARANYLDQYKFTFNYENLPAQLRNSIYKIYSFVRHFGYDYYSENVTNLSASQQNQVDVSAKFDYGLQSVNVSIAAPIFTSYFENFPVHGWIRPVVVAHPTYNAFQRLGQKLLRGEQAPTAVLDKDLVNTFDNRTYQAKFGNCWHVMTHYAYNAYHGQNSYESKEGGQNQYYQDFSILVRQPGSEQVELKVILGENEAEFQYSGSSFSGKYNGQQFNPVQKQQVNNEQGYTLFNFYQAPEGFLLIYAPQHGFKIYFDGSRVNLQVSKQYRGKLSGFAGNFDGEDYNEFTSPQKCVLPSGMDFAASYAINDGTCEGPAKERQQKVKNAECITEETIFGTVIYQGSGGMSRNIKKNRNGANMIQGSQKAQTVCGEYKVKTIQDKGRLCFSLRPQLSCSSRCTSERLIEKDLPFHCVTDSKKAALWSEMSKDGSQPNFAKLGSNLVANVKLPSHCVPN